MALRRVIRLAAAFSLCATYSFASGSEIHEAEVRTRIIEKFRIGSDETRFGALEFVGGLELTSDLGHLGALSSMRFENAGQRFIGVADTGFWYRGVIERDAQDRPTGISSFQMRAMPDRSGAYSNDKSDTDAEGSTIAPDGKLTVSFERHHRVSVYTAPGEAFAPAFERNVDFIVPEYELRNNRGFETVAYAPADSPLAGALVVVSEKSIDEQGNIFAAILDGPQKGIFTVKRFGEFDVTDGDFLPNGDLLVLERRFSMADSVGMRIRRIPAAEIRPGNTADGEIAIEADFSYQIDNMEGLDVWRAQDGSTRVSLISDNNHSLLQRNLYLEFRLADGL